MLLKEAPVRLAVGIALWLVAPLATANGAEFPMIQEGEGRIGAACKSALVLAKKSFNSISRRTDIPYDIHELSSDVKISDSQAVEKFRNFQENSPYGTLSLEEEIENYDGIMYWEPDDDNVSRVAVVSSNWRDSISYTIYILDKGLERNEFKKKATRDDGRAPEISSVMTNSPEDAFPIFKNLASKEIWFVDTNGYQGALADWIVYKNSSSESGRECIIRFKDKNNKEMNVLPASIRRLEALLASTLGPDSSGMHPPEPAIRKEVEFAWVHAAFRPWAAKEFGGYNTHEEINSGLLKWSKKIGKRQKIHAEILRLHPVAIRDLAAYYKSKFMYSSADSLRLATEAVDAAVSAHYVFHKKE